MLFHYYYKRFELHRRYMMKHFPGVDLSNLDFKAIDKEILVDKATATATDTLVGL